MIVLVAVVGAMLAIPLLLLVAGLGFFAIRAESSGPIQDRNVEERAEAVHAAPEPAAAVPVSEATQETAD